MNPLDHSLEKLLRAAAKARKEAPEPLPFIVEARILAQWRATEMEDDFVILARLFRPAMIFATTIVVLSGTWNYFEAKNEASTMALASYAIKMQLPP
jgi:hypothetical protein